MSAPAPLVVLGVVFLLFALTLLIAPLVLVVKRVRTWGGVLGLWISGWGFLLIGLGTALAYRGWGDLIIFGLVTTGVGHLVQRRAGGGENAKSEGAEK